MGKPFYFSRVLRWGGGSGVAESYFSLGVYLIKARDPGFTFGLPLSEGPAILAEPKSPLRST